MPLAVAAGGAMSRIALGIVCICVLVLIVGCDKQASIRDVAHPTPATPVAGIENAQLPDVTDSSLASRPSGQGGSPEVPTSSGESPGQKAPPTHEATGTTLVVWTESSTDEASAIRACRIDIGGRLLDSRPIAVGTGRFLSPPSLCFGTEGWLVVWMDESDKILAAHVGLDGAVSPQEAITVGTGFDWFEDAYRPSVQWTGSGWLVMYAVEDEPQNGQLVAVVVGSDGDFAASEPRQWATQGTRGALLAEESETGTAFLDTPFCLASPYGYAVVASAWITQGDDVWGVPRVSLVSSSGSSSSRGWMELAAEGRYRPRNPDNIFELAGAFGETSWLFVWSVQNDDQDTHEVRFARVSKDSTIRSTPAMGVLATQEGSYPAGLSVSSSGMSDEWLATWIGESSDSQERELVAAITDGQGRVAKRVLLRLQSGDRSDQVRSAWNGRQFIVAHVEEYSDRSAGLVVCSVARDGEVQGNPASLELGGAIEGLDAASDVRMVVPGVVQEVADALPLTHSAVAGRYLAPLNPDICLELNADGTFRLGLLGPDGVRPESAEQGQWSINDDGITVYLPLPLVKAVGQVTQDGLAFADEWASTFLGVFSVVWVREGAQTTFDLGVDWRRVEGKDDERLVLDNGRYELARRRPPMDGLQATEGTYSWDGRVARLKIPAFDMDTAIWAYVYLGGRLYNYDYEHTEIWECVDDAPPTLGAAPSAATTTSSTTAAAAVTRPVTTTTTAPSTTSTTPTETTPVSTVPPTKPPTATTTQITTSTAPTETATVPPATRTRPATATTTPSTTSTSPTSSTQQASGSVTANSVGADPCATVTGDLEMEYEWRYELLPKKVVLQVPRSALCASRAAAVPRTSPRGYPYSGLERLVGWAGDDALLGKLAREINKDFPDPYTNYYEIATNTLHFVQALMPYTKDAGDRWQMPVETLVLQEGDCEDGAVLYVALMQSLGLSDSVRLGVYEGHVFALVEVTADWKTKIETVCPNKCLDLLSNSWTVVQCADERLWALAETTVDPSSQTLGYTGLGCGRIPESLWTSGKVAMLAPDTGQPIRLVDVSSDEKLLRLWRFLLPDEVLPSPGSD